MRDVVKTTVPLFIICVVVAFSLAFVNGITKDTIAQRTAQSAEEKRMIVLNEAEEFKKIEGWESKDETGLIREVYEAYKDGNIVGYVFMAYPVGYGGEIPVTVGINSEGKIVGVEIGSNNETPGLGAKTADVKFRGQFTDKDIHEELTIVKRTAKTDNEIQAVSGATISSTAVTKAVQASAALGSTLLTDGGDDQ
jgi:electron transport complex protein RnfG